MIEKKTVLVLGAGASCHLGFPLGQKLIQDIYRLVHGKSAGVRKYDIKDYGVSFSNDEAKNSDLLQRFLKFSGSSKKDGQIYSSEDIQGFATRLFKAQQPSIDFFLQKNPQYSYLGKVCIIFCLSKYEAKDSWQYSPARYLHRPDQSFPDFGWYEYLWHKMIDGCKNIDDLKKNKITIIISNNAGIPRLSFKAGMRATSES